jgi:hypothetical protein
LGAEGQGTLILFKPLDNAGLKRLVIPEVSLSLTWQDRVVASSNEDFPTALADNKQQVVVLGDQRLVQARIQWPGTPSSGRCCWPIAN